MDHGLIQESCSNVYAINVIWDHLGRLNMSILFSLYCFTILLWDIEYMLNNQMGLFTLIYAKYYIISYISIKRINYLRLFKWTCINTMRCVALIIYNNICARVSRETGYWVIVMGTQEQAHIWNYCIT